jgi:tetratricopeptide (TPR) repeat protein
MISHPVIPSSRHPMWGWRWILFIVAALLLAGGITEAWWLLPRPATPVVPPMPTDIVDAKVLRAIERSRQKVLDEPTDANAWGLLGMTLWANLFDVEADHCFAEAARLNPNSPSWPYARGLIALRRDPDQALPFLGQALTVAGNTWPEYRSAVRLQLAEALQERQQFDEAERLFREEWNRNPKNERANLGLGLIALARGDEPDAADYLAVARRSKSARKNATAQLAVLARNRGDNAAAATYERETATLPADEVWPDPLRDEVVRFQVGQRALEREAAQLEREGRFAETVEIYRKQIERQPTAPAYVGAGVNLARMGHYEQALKCLHEALRLAPDDSQTHYTLALVQFTRAEKEWARSPGSLEAKEWFRETVTHAQRAAELKPDLARNYLHWGLALKYLGQPAEAVEPLRKGVACRPADLELQFSLGEVLLETGQRLEAETFLENARKLDPEDKRPLQALERLHQKKD